MKSHHACAVVLDGDAQVCNLGRAVLSSFADVANSEPGSLCQSPVQIAAASCAFELKERFGVKMSAEMGYCIDKWFRVACCAVLDDAVGRSMYGGC